MSLDAAIFHVCAVGAGHHHGGRGARGRRGFGGDIIDVVAIPDPSCIDGAGCTPAQVGAMERRNPLPAGRYWVDVFASDMATFNKWLVDNHVAVRSTQHFDAIDGNPSRDWILFEVTMPVPWNGPGFPTIADGSVTASSDTAVRPDPAPSIATQVETEAKQFFAAGGFFKGLLGVLVGAAVVQMLVNHHGGSR